MEIIKKIPLFVRSEAIVDNVLLITTKKYDLPAGYFPVRLRGLLAI